MVRKMVAKGMEYGQAKELRRMKFFATSLFVFAAVVFLFSKSWEQKNPIYGYVRAASEAAMVGALADWFAVTALFKHPLGLPIPHTAIIQKRKDQIGASLGGFVRDNFLTKSVIEQRLESAGLAARIGDWLSQPANAKSIGQQSAVAISGISEVLQDDMVQAGFEQTVTRKLQAVPTAAVAGRTLDVAISGGHHQVLFDSSLRSLSNFLDENDVVFRERFNKESPWWVPGAIDDKVFDKIYAAVRKFITEIAEDPSHRLRDDFHHRVERLSFDLKESPELATKAEEIKLQVLNHPEVKAWLHSLWDKSKSALLQASEDPNSELRLQLEKSICSAGANLQSDVELQKKVDRWIIQAIGYIAQECRDEVSDLISSTVAGWDKQETADRLELQVGKDLQFIRINGTIVGGLAGLAIHAFSELVW